MGRSLNTWEISGGSLERNGLHLPSCMVRTYALDELEKNLGRARLVHGNTSEAVHWTRFGLKTTVGFQLFRLTLDRLPLPRQVLNDPTPQ